LCSDNRSASIRHQSKPQLDKKMAKKQAQNTNLKLGAEHDDIRLDYKPLLPGKSCIPII